MISVQDAARTLIIVALSNVMFALTSKNVGFVDMFATKGNSNILAKIVDCLEAGG